MTTKQIFINIRVASLDKSIAFYNALGYTKDERFADETACAMVHPDNSSISVMIITPNRFKDFTPAHKTIVDAHSHTEVLLALSADSKEEVDETIEKAAKAGGKADPTKIEQMPGMYGRSYEDLDGHVWEVVWMDVEAMQAHFNKEKAADPKKE